jgi:hypothetical protein
MTKRICPVVGRDLLNLVFPQGFGEVSEKNGKGEKEDEQQ